MLILEGFSFHKNKDTRIENMQVKKQQLEPDMEQLTGSNLGKEYDKAVYTENIVQNARLDESQAGIKNARRNINLRYANGNTLMAENEEELKNLLMMVKEESEKDGLQLSIQNTKIMASSPITSWEIDGETVETVETVSDFIFLGSKITADGDCSHEIKRCLLLGRKAMTNLDTILKSKRHHLANKGLCSQTYVFPVIIYGCESWTIKKTEH